MRNSKAYGAGRWRNASVRSVRASVRGSCLTADAGVDAASRVLRQRPKANSLTALAFGRSGRSGRWRAPTLGGCARITGAALSQMHATHVMGA